MTAISELRRPIRRRIGRLVVTITPDGLSLRGFGCRRSRRVTWAQIAALSGDDCPVGLEAETQTGRAELERLRADPSASIAPAAGGGTQA